LRSDAIRQIILHGPKSGTVRSERVFPGHLLLPRANESPHYTLKVSA
jgi:hypothetical protein